MSKSKAKTDSFYLMLLGSVAFVLFGVVLMSADRVPLLDYRTAYYAGDCLVHAGCDPYSVADIDALYSQKVERFPVSDRNRLIINHNIYLPSVFPFTLPLALMPFDGGQALWLVMIVGSFLAACFLMWDLGCRHAPLLSGLLLAFCLANSGSLIYFGNPAGFVVPLCVIAIWCFVRQRHEWIGVACLTVSLAFKPHDVGLIWLYFLLAGGALRKRSLQTFAAIAVVSILGGLWAFHLNPHWPNEFSANLSVFSVRGGMNDPSAGHGTLVLTNLQAVTSFFWPDPHTYNLAAYLIFLPFLLVWMVVALRKPATQENSWFALAAVACFSLLPIYHRQYDAKLLILAIPGCALLWSRRGSIGWLALIVVWVAFILNGDLPWVLFLTAVNHFGLPTTGFWGRCVTAVWDFSVPLSLLAVGSVFLWAYAKSARVEDTGAMPVA
ncbi:MAG TPA: hypothetical protein VK716_04705 [Terracidiphilus sp.]|jgi:hypothetical protein|nr:hypothetical protein [Terracidiphilus sp.]